MGRANTRNTTVSTRETITSMAKQLPIIRSASPLFPRPSSMEARGAPPMASNAANAEITIMMGKQTPTPVSASFPTVSTGCMCPM